MSTIQMSKMQMWSWWDLSVCVRW